MMRCTKETAVKCCKCEELSVNAVADMQKSGFGPLAFFAVQRILIPQRFALSPSFGAFPPYDYCRAFIGAAFFLRSTQ